MVTTQFDPDGKVELHTGYAGVIYDDDKVFIVDYNCLAIRPISGSNGYGFEVFANNLSDAIMIDNSRIKAISKEYLYIDKKDLTSNQSYILGRE